MAAPDDGTRGFLPKTKILDFLIFVHKSALSTGFSFNSKYSSSLQTVLILTRLQKLPKQLKLNESRISTTLLQARLAVKLWRLEQLHTKF